MRIVRRRRPYMRIGLRRSSQYHGEKGIVIAMVAAFMVLVIGAMLALSIDVVTFYTARSEAQLAADSAALAGARAIANSGATTDSTGALLTAVEGPAGYAKTVALQVAQQNQVGGTPVAPGQVNVSFAGNYSNPTVSVTVQVTNLPTYFARILGTKTVTVTASATAEAYNPSAPPGATSNKNPPVAPICVKPWLLPNIDPTQNLATGPTIFNPTSGTVTNPALVGQGWPNNSGTANANLVGLHPLAATANPKPGRFYPGLIDSTDFPEPTQALPSCVTGSFTPYQVAIAGCVSTPISCGSGVTIGVDTGSYASSTGSRSSDTVEAVECLIHYNGANGDTDSIDPTISPSPPFQFLGGNENPVANAIGKDILVSDSLVTIPVYDITAPENGAPVNPVNIIGFLQVFLNPQSAILPINTQGIQNQIPVTIVNMIGCGTSSSGPPVIQGNGGSPVAVRLITPP